MKLDKKIFQVVDINDTKSDKEYWHSLTGAERLHILELMRLMAYGEDAINAGVEKVLTIVKLSDLK